MYEINNLTFRYMLSDRNSLEQVSLKIKKGKITLKTFKKRTAAQR